MARLMSIIIITVMLPLLVSFWAPTGNMQQQQQSFELSVQHYQSTCPNVSSIVTEVITSLTARSNVVPPALLRLLMHDAIVQGCDASILITSTLENEAERDYPESQSIRQEAFDAVERAKEAVEAICPRVVSCADILVLAARDAVVLSGGPTWEVPLGRLDGLVSSASNVAAALPIASFNVQQLASNFGALGLTLLDLVVLSGAHTVGFAHCSEFRDRLYDFHGTNQADPSMDPNFVETVKQNCPPVEKDQDASTIVPFDATTPLIFDESYYLGLERGEGLLFSDQVLFSDPETQSIVSAMASSQQLFFDSFVQSMIKFTSIVALQPGNIRNVCSTFNRRTDDNITAKPSLFRPECCCC
ncbi:hypothetical protein KP509_18G004200 [Ceratopteris richardii]|uniref:Peroxidase n=1 Tax=Ceratopteris richardii TaxID=49495 RepID=A0A8T2SP89_CERRI|nr:hypothetical protein KP509_18G004200 [Ceratopteris richardii]